MAVITTSAILCLILLISSIEAGSQQRRDVIVHEGQCPSNNLLHHIHCRRRVCRPEELTPLCKGDGDCAIAQKCCRPMCSCRDRCVQAVKEQNYKRIKF